MKIGRSLAEAAHRFPLAAPLVRQVQNSLRIRRSRRNAARLAADGCGAPAPAQMGGFAASPAEYSLWIAAHEPQEADLRRQRATSHAFSHQPLISIVLPVYKVPLEILTSTLESLKKQTYPHWEACIAFADPDGEANAQYLRAAARKDPRIRLTFPAANGGIAANSNEALALAQGEFIALVDHDDELTPHALYEMVEAINADPEADFLYSDKDSIDEQGTLRQNALFKPNWSPEVMFSVNYLTHFNLLRRSIVMAVGGFRSETDGAQDWDVFLRVAERSRSIVRVPSVHYHWRIHAASTSSGIAAKPYVLNGQLRTLQDHVVRLNLPATVEPNEDSGFRVCWSDKPGRGVHLIIDAQGIRLDDLDGLVRHIAEAAEAAHLRVTITVVAEGQRWHESSTHLGGLERGRVEVLACPPENRSRCINEVIARHLPTTDALLFLSGQVAGLSENWLSELVGWVCGHPDIGFASGLILDTQSNVVEAGLVVDQFGAGSPMFRDSPLRKWGWFGGPLWYRNCTAASPWLVAIHADAYVSAGGFDERQPWNRSFIGLCQTIHRGGKRGVVDPHARATLAPGVLPPVPPFHASLRDDPYFHPAFSSVVPLELDTCPSSGQSEIRAEGVRQGWLKMPWSGAKSAKRTLGGGVAKPGANAYAADALILARVTGCTLEDLHAQQQYPERVGRGPGAGWCNWYLPPFENPYYGGVMTILRFADFLQRTRGIRQRFLICGQADAGQMRERIARVFPGLSAADVRALDCPEAIIAIPPADSSVATLWTTAYVLLNVRNTGLKFYFLQDFEPLFYPAGSTSAQAELTYRFGFYGIANTRTLRALYEQDYDGNAVHFAPQVDPAVFHGSPERISTGPKRLFLYGRPGHPRNGFELAAAGIRLLKEKVGDRVEILCAGAPWDPREYGLDGIITNLGLLSYAETAELYRSCHIGFVMMMTKHPSYLPFEFMACGGLLVSNHNPANTWLLKDNENCLLAPASAPAIAQRLAYSIDHFDQLLPLRQRGHELITRHHSNWDRAFSNVLSFMDGLSPQVTRRVA